MNNELIMANFFFCILAIGFILSFVLYSMFDTFFRKIKRKFLSIHWVKTENGRLYRAVNGVYTTKERCFEISQQHKFKRKQFWIQRHQRILNHLQKDD